MKRCIFVTPVVLLVVFTMSLSASAQPGPAPADSAIAEYDPTTGQIVVSVNSVPNWYVDSASGGLTGAEPSGLPAGGGILTNNDNQIGETNLVDFTYTNLDLGLVAMTNLPVGDLNIFWNASLGIPVQSQPVVYLGPMGLPGDYNDDGTVNAADYTVWRNGNSPDPSLAGYDLWKDNFNMTAGGAGAAVSSAGSQAIPEPASIAALITAVLTCGVFVRRR